MNDKELDLAIAELIYPRNGWHIYRDNSPKDSDLYIQFEGHARFEKISFCNDWSILMPLVVEHGLLEDYILFRDGKDYQMHSGKGSKFHVVATSYQRALAECLLKVLESKKECK